MRAQRAEPCDFLSKLAALNPLTLKLGENHPIHIFCPLSPCRPLRADEAKALKLGVRNPPIAAVLYSAQLATLDPLPKCADAGAGQLSSLLSRVGLHAPRFLHVPSVPFQGPGDRGDKFRSTPEATVPVMTVEATLQATGVRLVLGVEGYQYPQFDTGWDANWLVCDVQLDVQDQLNSQDHATFHAHLRPSIVTFELQDFVSQLRALIDDRTGQAILEHLEKRIGLTIALDAGQATVEGFLTEQTAGRLSFRPAEIDRSSLRETLAQLEAIVDAFPARGRLNDPH